ncbi:MAG: dTMP kinase, partial [Candidatus Acidiferrales bacterium]
MKRNSMKSTGNTITLPTEAEELTPVQSESAGRPYQGALIVVEGIDGSGKSTQLYLLKRWLEIGGYRIHFT